MFKLFQISIACIQLKQDRLWKKRKLCTLLTNVLKMFGLEKIHLSPCVVLRYKICKIRLSVGVPRHFFEYHRSAAACIRIQDAL